VSLVVVATMALTIGPGPRIDRRARAGTRFPDVVLIVTDDQRADAVSHMPQVRRRLMRRGMRFRSAYAPNPTCCPSRASIFTGTYSHTNGVWNNGGEFGGFKAFDDSSTLATWLDDIGYRTGLFGKYLNEYVDPAIVPPGWDEWFGFLADPPRVYYGFDVSLDGTLRRFPDDVYSTVESYERMAGFIRSTPQDRPLFAVWTPSAPHRPFIPEARYAAASLGLTPWRPPNYNERDQSDKPLWLRRVRRLTGPERRTIDAERIDQHRTLLSVDDGVEEIVRALRQAGRLSRTLIVYTSDNGLMWGEHRLYRKAVPYSGASRVPVIVRYDPLVRSRRRGSTVGSSVVNIDIAPTVMDLVGAAPGSPVEGRSLRSLLDGSATRVRTRFLIEHAAGGPTPPYCGARTRHELFVRYATGEEEYYRLDQDPWELQNVARKPSWRKQVRELRAYARRRCRPVPPGFTW
jgi:arylsulfatase A-like enzyme